MTHATLTPRGLLGIAAAVPALSLPIRAGAAPQAQPDGPWNGCCDTACAAESIPYRTLGDGKGEPLTLIRVSSIDAMSRADLVAHDAERKATGSRNGVIGISSFATMDPYCRAGGGPRACGDMAAVLKRR